MAHLRWWMTLIIKHVLAEDFAHYYNQNPKLHKVFAEVRCCWCAQADVAVLDEIDSGLDIDALRDVADAVNGLKRPNSAMLMVTHYKVVNLMPVAH